MVQHYYALKGVVRPGGVVTYKLAHSIDLQSRPRYSPGDIVRIHASNQQTVPVKIGERKLVNGNWSYRFEHEERFMSESELDALVDQTAAK